MTTGLTYGKSNKTFAESNTIIVDALNSIAPIKIVAEINHSSNAASVDKKLNPTKVILFGNPALGTPLMQKNQLAGLDLPQKLLLIEDEDGQLNISFNSVAYLTKRHSLEGVATLEKISGALTNFASKVATEELLSNGVTDLAPMEGVVIKTSANSFDETYSKLIAAIEGNEKLKIIAALDHQANANSIDLNLNPTRLVVFGNPNLGTPLMQSAQTIGIDLPQKMLVYENDEGLVQVAYNNPTYLAKRHSLKGSADTLTTVAGALNNLSNAAIS